LRQGGAGLAQQIDVADTKEVFVARERVDHSCKVSGLHFDVVVNQHGDIGSARDGFDAGPQATVIRHVETAETPTLCRRRCSEPTEKRVVRLAVIDG
jgi:hypothetical protein